MQRLFRQTIPESNRQPIAKAIHKKLNTYHCRATRHKVRIRRAQLCPSQTQCYPELFVISTLKLDEEYRLIRTALVDAGIDMTDSMDALYRDWRRWRDKPRAVGAVARFGIGDADQWWARHLAQFRSLIDPPHVAARAERARKDRTIVRTAPHAARSKRPSVVAANTAV
jgi:hypothetical protein